MMIGCTLTGLYVTFSSIILIGPNRSRESHRHDGKPINTEVKNFLFLYMLFVSNLMEMNGWAAILDCVVLLATGRSLTKSLAGRGGILLIKVLALIQAQWEDLMWRPHSALSIHYFVSRRRRFQSERSTFKTELLIHGAQSKVQNCTECSLFVFYRHDDASLFFVLFFSIAHRLYVCWNKSPN